jgi:hypothetical protein
MGHKIFSVSEKEFSHLVMSNEDFSPPSRAANKTRWHGRWDWQGRPRGQGIWAGWLEVHGRRHDMDGGGLTNVTEPITDGIVRLCGSMRAERRLSSRNLPAKAVRSAAGSKTRGGSGGMDFAPYCMTR